MLMNWFDRKARPWLAQNLGPHCAYSDLAQESINFCLLEEELRCLNDPLREVYKASITSPPPATTTNAVCRPTSHRRMKRRVAYEVSRCRTLCGRL